MGDWGGELQNQGHFGPRNLHNNLGCAAKWDPLHKSKNPKQKKDKWNVVNIKYRLIQKLYTHKIWSFIATFIN